MSKFVKTKVVESKEIVDFRDTRLKNYAFMSVVKDGPSVVMITIGAMCRHAEGNSFSKSALQDLIDDLTAIEGAMQ